MPVIALTKALGMSFLDRADRADPAALAAPAAPMAQTPAVGRGQFPRARYLGTGCPEMVLPAGDAEHLTQAAALAASGKRVLALAHSEAPLAGESLPGRLRAAAFVLLTERLRPDAAGAIRYFTEQGVALKVISGDSPHTVSAVAASAGLPQASGSPTCSSPRRCGRRSLPSPWAPRCCPTRSFPAI